MKRLDFAANGLNGQVQVPGDKSLTHRAIILGSVAAGQTQIVHYLAASDCWNTVNAFKQMGVRFAITPTTLTIQGRMLNQLNAPKHPLMMGNSGTTTRLLLGLLAQQPFPIKLIGDASLSRRPLLRVTEPLALMGAKIITRAGHLPAQINPRSRLTGIKYRMPIASAQVKSALIFAALQASTPSLIEEPLASRDHTERLLPLFGVKLKRQGNTIKVVPQPRLHQAQIVLPGDFSAAAFWLVAGLITPHSRLVLKNVGLNPTRIGLLHLLNRMGAQVTVKNRHQGFEPFGDLWVKSQKLHGITVTAGEIPGAIDEIPLLVLAATQAQGPTKITGAQELRVKETDRITQVTQELNQLGAKITALPDGFLIPGATPLHCLDPVVADSHGDHRIAMMLAVAALITSGTVYLKRAGAIAISYPNFFADLAQLIK